MRHRVSFVQSNDVENAIRTLNSSYVELAAETAAREDRHTYPVPEMSHVASVAVHVAKEHAEQPHLVFGYDYQRGLHIYVTPRPVADPNERATFYNQLDAHLAALLGVSVPQDAWVLSLNSFYYHTLEILEPVSGAVPDWDSTWAVFDYYYADGSVVAKRYAPETAKTTVDASSAGYTEIGVFGVDSHSTRDDVVLTGVRVVLNDADADPADGFVHRTLFHVKPRHRHVAHVPTTVRPNGLHPVLAIEQAPREPADDDVAECTQFIYLTLDKLVFLDPYQLPDNVAVVAQYGTRDLELPEYSTPGWGTEVLLEVDAGATYPLELTLHSRYQRPGNGTHTQVAVDKPVVFYACDATVDAFLLSNSPFDNKKRIGGTFEKFFTNDTVFYHALDRGVLRVDIPHAAGSRSPDWVTVLALLAGVGYILWQMLRRRQSESKKKTE